MIKDFEKLTIVHEGIVYQASLHNKGIPGITINKASIVQVVQPEDFNLLMLQKLPVLYPVDTTEFKVLYEPDGAVPREYTITGEIFQKWLQAEKYLRKLSRLTNTFRGVISKKDDFFNLTFTGKRHFLYCTFEFYQTFTEISVEHLSGRRELLFTLIHKYDEKLFNRLFKERGRRLKKEIYGDYAFPTTRLRRLYK